MSTLQQKYDALLKSHINLEVRVDLLEVKLKQCEEKVKLCQETVKQLQEMVQNQQKEIALLRTQVNDLMGLGKKKK